MEVKMYEAILIFLKNVFSYFLHKTYAIKSRVIMLELNEHTNKKYFSTWRILAKLSFL